MKTLGSQAVHTDLQSGRYSQIGLQPWGAPRKIGWKCSARFPKPLPIRDQTLRFSLLYVYPETRPTKRRKLNSLLYADHLVILSRSKIGLQNCLDFLSSHCSTWLLSINPKKNKVMIFQKRAKKYIDSNFHIDNEPVEIVQNYTYLLTPFLQR